MALPAQALGWPFLFVSSDRLLGMLESQRGSVCDQKGVLLQTGRAAQPLFCLQQFLSLVAVWIQCFNHQFSNMMIHAAGIF